MGEQALAVARARAHAFQTITLSTLAILHKCRGDVRAVQTCAEALMRLGAEHCFSLFEEVGAIFQDWVAAVQVPSSAGGKGGNPKVGTARGVTQRFQTNLRPFFHALSNIKPHALDPYESFGLTWGVPD